VKIGNQAINARFESVATKPMFRSALKSRRCLIPASGYYEWAKMPFYVARKDGVPFIFAGLWERWGPDNLPSCTIITTDATEGIRGLHTRMPVILPKDGFGPWLTGSDPAVDPEIDAAVKITPVSPKMNEASNNEPACVEPLAS
jgi:putative SOS response-associated peptidase YedK